jgi:hypothetical protein
MTATDRFLEAPIEEARQGLREGGIPIGFIIVHRERIILARSQSLRSEAQRHPARMLGSCASIRFFKNGLAVLVGVDALGFEHTFLPRTDLDLAPDYNLVSEDL